MWNIVNFLVYDNDSVQNFSHYCDRIPLLEIFKDICFVCFLFFVLNLPRLAKERDVQYKFRLFQGRICILNLVLLRTFFDNFLLNSFF